MPPAPSNGGFSLGDLYSKCVQMVNENKISTKNAFDLPLIEHIDEVLASFMDGRAKGGGGGGSFGSRQPADASSGGDAERRFHEASCTIEASARIYACRVDRVHTDTYGMWSGLSSADLGAEEDGKEGEEGKGPAKRRRICGVNTLEKNEANIVQHHLEADEQSDPSFRRMAAAFDAGGAKGLLLSHLPIAEDLSLVFNGDVPVSRAQEASRPMFAAPRCLPSKALGLGPAEAARARLAEARACPEVDRFRQELFGAAVSAKVPLPDCLEALLALPVASSIPQNALVPASACGRSPPPVSATASGPPLEPLADAEACMPAAEDVGCADALPEDFPPQAGSLPPASPAREPAAAAAAESLALPLADAESALVPLDTSPKGEDVVIAFDELYERFSRNPGTHQFAYFDECWAKHKDGKACAAIEDGDKENVAAGGRAPAAAENAPEKRPPKRPIFDLSALGKPPRAIETEPVHKHQLSERAAQWQLHKDVPPYMIDRITMPSWPTWSKCDFACLGLRPHLMLKLVRKSPPNGAGPHSFADLFSTVVVENPEAFPWLAAEARGAAAASSRNDANDDDAVRAEQDMELGEDGGEEDFNGSGLPAHLDVDPNDMFLRPDDKVLSGVDQEDLPGSAGEEGGLDIALDIGLADMPLTVGDVGIAYSRNSKFVDVKLVKKHLWDCISIDIEEAKAAEEAAQAASSFQDLVGRTVRRLPKVETENLSVAVCFICALHLCNEKGLELKTDPEVPLGDFAVLGPPE